MPTKLYTYISIYLNTELCYYIHINVHVDMYVFLYIFGNIHITYIVKFYQEGLNVQLN